MEKKSKIVSYRDLIVWQKAIELVVVVYNLTKLFPKEELYCLTSQIRRAAVSIASNIAEGRMRGSRPEFMRFLAIAYASGAELETQIEIAKRIFPIGIEKYQETDTLLNEVQRMLNSMLAKKLIS